LLDDDGLPLDITSRAQAFAESIELLLVSTGVSQEANAGDLADLLRARRERPRHCRAAEQRDELAALHCPMPPVLLTERIAHHSYGRRLLRCGISTAPMSRWRHPRPRRAKPHVMHFRFAPKATVGH